MTDDGIAIVTKVGDATSKVAVVPLGAPLVNASGPICTPPTLGLLATSKPVPWREAVMLPSSATVPAEVPETTGPLGTPEPHRNAASPGEPPAPTITGAPSPVAMS